MLTGSPFHQHEQAIQDRLGISEQYRQRVSQFIRDEMPEQHQTFFNGLPFVLLAALDEQGYPWLTPVFGDKGFIHIHSATEFTLSAAPTLTNAIALQLQPKDKIGLLGIELETRRRNRLNGVIKRHHDNSMTVQVDQSFGNCPKYIQRRDIKWQTSSTAPTIHHTSGLNSEWKSFIEKTDTFFIASRTAQLNDARASGLDASHRGGNPGFIKVEGNTLTFPDFSGNNFFNTLGNIQSDARVGLFIPDFQTGDAYFIAGRASIDWDEAKRARYNGALRFISIEVERSILIASAMPIRATSAEISPALVGTGHWVDPTAKVLPKMVFESLFSSGYEFGRRQTGATRGD